jgi:acyl-CoA synthetase (AMP-forming)/AMP-acid ligase II
MSRESVITPDNDTIGAVLRRWTEQFGANPALYEAAGATSFAEIDARALDLARGLLAAGVTKGAHVGILMPNGVDFLVALFATMRIGGIAVLLSTLARPPELAHMIRTADVDTLLMADRFLSSDYVSIIQTAFPALEGNGTKRLLATEAPFLRRIWVWGTEKPAWSSGGPDALIALADSEGVTAELASAAEREVVPADPAVIIYSSGSTAEPKAVIHSHGNLVRQSIAMAKLASFEVGDRALSTSPFFWVGGLCTFMMANLCSGASIVCPEDPSIEAIIRAFDQWGGTQLMLWEHQVDLMRDRPEIAKALQSLKPGYAPQMRMLGVAPPEVTPDSLGMTETLGPHSAYPMEILSPEHSGSFGIAVGSIERRIVDPETGRPLLFGELGLLSMRGGALMIGVHRKERSEVFDADGFYRTDDLCTLSEDGHLYFKGRDSDVVKVNAANVSAAEVERAIRNEVKLKSVCVLGLQGGGTSDTLVAVLVPEDGVAISTEDLRARLKTQLSSYKVPRHLVVMTAEELPMTASGKIYKPALRELLAQKVAS